MRVSRSNPLKASVDSDSRILFVAVSCKHEERESEREKDGLRNSGGGQASREALFPGKGKNEEGGGAATTARNGSTTTKGHNCRDTREAQAQSEHHAPHIYKPAATSITSKHGQATAKKALSPREDDTGSRQLRVCTQTAPSRCSAMAALRTHFRGDPALVPSGYFPTAGECTCGVW